MGVLINAIIATLAVMIIGGGGFYLIWLKTRPRKQTWEAWVYQLGQGVLEKITDDKGNILRDISLQDLKPYARDTIEETMIKDKVVYRLIKLRKQTPAVEAKYVEYWGEKRKIIHILLDKGTPVFLEKGYDKETAKKIYTPIPSDTINLIKSEIIERKNKLEKEKDILQAITPWVVAGICILGMVAVSYVMITGFIEVSENIKIGQIAAAESLGNRVQQNTEQKEVSLGPAQPKEEPAPIIEEI